MFNYEYWGNGTFSSHLNMALEEFSTRRAAIAKKGVIRFFDFNKDAVVLGYAQAPDILKTNPFSDSSFDLTRRITGGSHVQQGKNFLSYSFSVPRDGTFTHYEDMRGYYAEQIALALGDLGVEGAQADNKASCITVDGKLIAAHAAFWGIESGLLHGMLFIDPYDVEKVAQRVNLQVRKIGGKEYSEYTALKNLPALSKILDMYPNASEAQRTEALKQVVADAILKRVTNHKHEKQSVDEKVSHDAFELLRQKFSTDRWISKRNPVFTKDSVDEIPGEELSGKLKEKQPYCMFLQVKDKEFKHMAQTQD